MYNEQGFPDGVWPTMITPFRDGEVDYEALKELIDWYIDNGVSGLFSVCQSSEMFYLNLAERVSIAKFVKQYALDKVPVITSGHISDRLSDQIDELNEMAETGVDALILITNRLAHKYESDDKWYANLQIILRELPEDLPLGFYECPYPYKRLLNDNLISRCQQTDRFYFIKDTSCDLDDINAKLSACRGSRLKLYNANTSTLLPSLRLGASGYSGVMVNMQCRLYSWLCNNKDSLLAEQLADELSICSLIERQLYPINAKYYLSLEGINIDTECRAKSLSDFTQTFRSEMHMLKRITERMNKKYLMA